MFISPLTFVQTEGVSNITWDEKEDEVIFLDENHKPLFIYSSPAFHTSNKENLKGIAKTTWSGASKELRIRIIFTYLQI